MIGFFPEMFPDELLLSVCSRYAERSDYHSTSITRDDLFKSRRFVPSADFPSRLGILISVLPPGHGLTIDRLINDHTLLPLFTPYLPVRRVSIIRDRMMRPHGGHLHGSLGVNTFPAKLKTFRYCPACVAEDRATYGETYWHRSHHIPAVNLCATHKIYLRCTDVPLRNTKSSVVFATAEASLVGADLGVVHERKDPLLKVQATLARDAMWLLQNPIFAGYETNHRNRYVQLLYEGGYCTYRGILDRRKLSNDLSRYYSRAFLETIKCEVATDRREDWLTRLAHRRERLLHPIHHLLLQQFLGHNPQSFLTDVEPMPLGSKSDPPVILRTRPRIIASFFREPFGTGPWPCLNPVSDHFQEEVVTICEITSTQLHPRRPRGTFRCKCGFTYSRTGPDRVHADRYKIDRYVSFGDLWENELREALARRDEYLVICRRLRISPNTMLRQMIRLGIRGARGRTVKIRHSTPPLKKTDPKRTPCPRLLQDRRRIPPKIWAQRRRRNRRKLLRFLKANPDFSRNQVRAGCTSSYAWLYTRDRAWLEEHLPAPWRFKPKRLYSIWSEKDGVLAAAVQLEAEKIRARPGRPLIISATSIARALEIVNVWTKRPEVLPLTCEALTKFGETRDQFAVRRIEWAAAEFKKQGLSVGLWRIALHAGLSGRTIKKPAVKAALDKVVESLKAQVDLAYSTVSAA